MENEMELWKLRLIVLMLFPFLYIGLTFYFFRDVPSCNACTSFDIGGYAIWVMPLLIEVLYTLYYVGQIAFGNEKPYKSKNGE